MTTVKIQGYFKRVLFILDVFQKVKRVNITEIAALWRDVYYGQITFICVNMFIHVNKLTYLKNSYAQTS